MRIFPNAKVVLTVREPEKWYESVKNTIFQNVELSQGTTGTFIKLIRMSKVHNLVIRLLQQGPPITRYGNILTIVTCISNQCLIIIIKYREHACLQFHAI